MKKTFALLSIVLLLPLLAHSEQKNKRGSTFPEEVKERKVSSVSVKGHELILIAKKRVYFWKSCSSVGLDTTTGYDAISLGDTIRYKNIVVPVGVIKYIEHQETTTSDNSRPAAGYLDIVFASYSSDSDTNVKLAPHNADCIIASDEAHLPGGNSCENTWILVEGCSVLKD